LPYVLFVCWDQESLDHIVSVIKTFNHNYEGDSLDPVDLLFENRLICGPEVSGKISLRMCGGDKDIVAKFTEHICSIKETVMGDMISEDVLPEKSLIIEYPSC
jgi:hypothetical protein